MKREDNKIKERWEGKYEKQGKIKRIRRWKKEETKRNHEWGNKDKIKERQ